MDRLIRLGYFNFDLIYIPRSCEVSSCFYIDYRVCFRLNGQTFLFILLFFFRERFLPASGIGTYVRYART